MANGAWLVAWACMAGGAGWYHAGAGLIVAGVALLVTTLLTTSQQENTE